MKALACAAALCAALGEAQALPAVWVGASNGYWDVAGNWSPGLPGLASDVTLGTSATEFRSGTVAVNSFTGTGLLTISGGTLAPVAASSVGALALTGGTLDGGGVVSVSNASQWTGGTMSGTGSTNFNGPLAISGTGTTRLITGRTVNFSNTTNWTNSYPGCCQSTYGQIVVANGAVLNNSGTWNDLLSYAVGIYASGTASTFNNSGTYNKSGQVPTEIQTVFNNTGALAVNASTLVLNGGGTLNGTVDVAGGAALNLNAGSFTVSGISSSNGGSGQLTVGGGTVTSSGVNNFSGAVGTSGGTFNINGTFTAGSFNTSAGTMGGAGTLVVNGGSVWTGGTLSGSGSTTFNGPLAISGTGTTRQIAGRTVTFANTTTWTNAYPGCCQSTYGQIVLANGAVMNNTGTWLDQLSYGVGIYVTGAPSTFNNIGRYAKSGQASTEIQAVFNNAPAGALAVDTNMLVLSGGGTLNGTVDVAGGATLNLSAGSFAVAGISSAGAGSGLLTASGGTVTTSGVNSFSGTVGASGGTLNVGGSFTASGFNTTAGTVGGPGALSIYGASVWTGGTLTGSGSTTFNGPLAISGTGTSRLIAGRTVNFANTTTWTNSYPGCCQSTYGQIVVANGAVLNNSGTWQDQLSYGVGIYTSGAPSTFNNSGSYIKSGQAATEIQAVFNNTPSGALSVNTSAMVLSGGGTINGTVDVAGGSTLTLNGGSFTIAGVNSAGAGSGLLTVAGGTVTTTGTNNFSGAVGASGGTLNVGGAFTAGGFNTSSGVLGGAGALVINGGGVWTGGTLTGSGSTTVNGSLAISGTGSTRQIAGRTVNFAGTTSWTNSYPGCCQSNYGQIAVANGAVLNNSGLWLDQLSYGVGIVGSGTPSTFNNTGRYEKSGAVTTDLSTINFVNSGVVDVQQGTLQLQTNAVNGGTLMGRGSIAATTLTNNGHVMPGESTGTLTLAGSFVQTSAGVLDIELESATSFDLLKITGSATLGGRLNLVCFGDCALVLGQTFKILDAAPNSLVGSFSSITTTGFAANAFSVMYDRLNGDVLLNVTAVPEPAAWMLWLGGLALMGALAKRRGLNG